MATAFDLSLDGTPHTSTVQVLVNHCLCLVYYIMKAINMTPVHSILLEFIWNNNFIIVCYNSDFIISLTKKLHLSFPCMIEYLF